MSDKKVIGVAQVLQHLKDGLTREEIAEHYGITTSECKILFKDPRLKGRKTIKKPSFVLVEDETSEIPVVDAEKVEQDTVEQTTEETQAEDGAEKTKEVEEKIVVKTEKKAFGAKYLDTNAKKEGKVEEKKEEPVEEITTNAPKATWD